MPVPAPDEYLKARDDFANTAMRIREYAAQLNVFAGVLSRTPQEAYVALPALLYTREEVQMLLSEAMTAFDKMHGLWSRIPAERRKTLPAPPKTLGS